MASASCEIAVGFRSSAEPGTTNSVTCATVVGFATAASPVPWAGAEESRDVSDWLPRIDEPVLDPRTGRFNKRWWNYFRVLGERLGGVQGASIPQVQESVQATQILVAVNTASIDSAIAYTDSVAATAAATAEVAQTNNLSGADSIPPPADRPTRPGYQVP
jgi:hypothetical protein